MEFNYFRASFLLCVTRVWYKHWKVEKVSRDQKHYLRYIVSTLLSFVICSNKLKIVIFQLFLLFLISRFGFLVQCVPVATKKMPIARNYFQIHILDMNKQIIQWRKCCCHSQWINKTFKRCVVWTGIKNYFHKLKKKTKILQSFQYKEWYSVIFQPWFNSIIDE